MGFSDSPKNPSPTPDDRADRTSHRGPRYLAQAKAFSVELSNAYFKSLGLPSLSAEG